MAMAVYTIQTSAGNLAMCVFMRSYKLNQDLHKTLIRAGKKHVAALEVRCYKRLLVISWIENK